MRSTTRAFWMAVHRYSGLAMLVFVAFAALTGSALVFVRDIDVALNADLFRQPAVAAPADVPAAVEAFRAANPAYTVQSFPLSVAAADRIPVKVSAAPDGTDQVFLDRATGALAGTRSDAPAFTRHGFAKLLHDIHYTLMLGDDGRWFMGAVALAWLVSQLVGLYLTFPERGAFWRQWKRTWRWSPRSVFPRQMLDLHRASGLWLFAPLVLLALTSVAMNFFAEAYEPLAEIVAPEKDLPLPAHAASGPIDFPGAVGAARAIAATLEPGWQPATVLYDKAEGLVGVTLTDDGKLNYRHLGPIYLYFDAASGRLAEVVDPYHGQTHLALIRTLYPVHSGRIAGLATIALVFVLGLVIFGQCVTGIYLWWKKRPSRVRQRRIAR